MKLKRLGQLFFMTGLLVVLPGTGVFCQPNSLQVPVEDQEGLSSSSYPQYTNPNKLISLNFSGIEVRKLLQLLAQFKHKNIVISDSVIGKISINLNKVTWSQALSVVLHAKGLGKENFGNVLLVAPIAELESKEVTRIQSQQKKQQLVATHEIQKMQDRRTIGGLAPLFNSVFPLHYGKAEDIVKLLTSSGGSLLSPNGQVSADKRTNSIWIRAPFEQLNSVKRLITKLDRPAKQVIIEARIVRLERPFQEELGARFGITSPKTLSGTLAGANQLQQNIAPANVNPFTDRLNFNLPAAPQFGTPWSIGLALAKLGSNMFLDLELSALEEEGKVQLVSTPSLLTLDNQTAYIQTGEEIPYQESTSSGATSIQYQNASLELQVTPQITSQKRVILNLKVSNNSAAAPITLSGGGQAIPINTEEEQSQVLVNDRQTIVLGGIYTQNKQKTITRMPFLGRLPLIGWLFRRVAITDSRTELLIFLTPHIIKDPKSYYLSKEQADIWHKTAPVPLVKKPKDSPLTNNEFQRGMLATKPIRVLPDSAFEQVNMNLPAPRSTLLSPEYNEKGR